MGSPKKGAPRKPKPRSSNQDQLKLGLKLAFPTLIAIAGIFFAYNNYFSEVAVQTLYASDTVKLKDVFFSGTPWIVACKDDEKTQIPSAVEKSSGLLKKSKIYTGTLNCSEVLPSGKTTLQRFKLNPKRKPVVFMAANSKSITQVPSSALTSTSAFQEYATKFSELLLTTPGATKDLHRLCFSKKSCVVVLNRGPLHQSFKNEIAKLMKKHRSIPYFLIDARKRELSLKINVKTEPRLIFFMKNSTAEAKELNRTLDARSYSGEFKASRMSQFIDQVQSGDLQSTWLKTLPYLKPAKGVKTSVPPPPVSMSDKERHKADRETAKQNARDEIEAARERERQRRAQMDEEAESLIKEIDDSEEFEFDANPQDHHAEEDEKEYGNVEMDDEDEIEM